MKFSYYVSFLILAQIEASKSYCSRFCEPDMKNVGVCFSDKAFYPNHCQASCENADTDFLFLCKMNSETDAHMCEKFCQDAKKEAFTQVFNHPQCSCPRLYDPVCGNNGFTFFNECFLNCNKIKKSKNGSCKSTSKCPYANNVIYAPVCASGLTFANAALAGCAGHTEIVDGPC